LGHQALSSYGSTAFHSCSPTAGHGVDRRGLPVLILQHVALEAVDRARGAQRQGRRVASHLGEVRAVAVQVEFESKLCETSFSLYRFKG
jgi:hypothetical protein